MPAGATIVYRFEDFELDPGRFELRRGGNAIPLEPQVLSLLILLAGNAERLVSKDEIAEKVWNNPGISDATIASRVKSARRALGDDGSRQRLIRTVHGKGLRFVGEVAYAGAAVPIPSAAMRGQDQVIDERPSIAVLPFRVIGEPGPLDFVADALADELIAELARLRWLLVIARSSTFRFRGGVADCSQVGTALNVRYCLSGTLQSRADRVTLSVELARTSDSAVVWAERFTAGWVELQQLQQEILTHLVAKLEIRIVHHEVELARRAPVSGLDAWSSYHLGLDHMFRFSRADNLQAAALFERALAMNPGFSRALSGLSFTCFQDQFLQYSGRGEATALRARRLAEQAIACDPLDPFAHLNLGRSLWLENAVPESLARLEDCIALSPNHAQAIYSRSWAEMILADAEVSDAHAALAQRLSPLDPLRYAMLGVRCVSALFQGDHARAAELGEMAARSPGAHKHIAVIAAVATHADGRLAQAVQWISRARQLDPELTPTSFFRSFPFVRSPGRELIEKGFHALGFRSGLA